MLHKVTVGAKAWWNGKPGTITMVVSLSQVGFLADGEGKPKTVSISELTGSAPETPAPPVVAALKPWQLAIAHKRYEVLKPFLGAGSNHKGLKEAIDAAPPDARLSQSTAYRLLQNWIAYPELAALAPSVSSGGRGKSRLPSDAADTAMQECIEKHYAVRSEPTIMTVYNDHLPSYCRVHNCPVPSYDVFRRRIKSTSPYDIMKGRKGSRAARRQFSVNLGSNPLSTGPLDCVQMDFWAVHVILVDARTREPIGRPYLSLASCTTTRMTYGYHLSFDPPNASAAALTIMRGAMPKDEILKRLGIDEEWPVWGFPKILHVDNALEYRSDLLKSLAMKDQRFEIMHRPVRTPHFGGTIESRFKTLASKLYHVPGSTGFNTIDRPDKSAVPPIYTIDEFEKILVNLLIEHSNTKSVSLNNMTPRQVWEGHFFSKSGEQIAELPSRPLHPERLLVECYPFHTAKLRSNGLVWDYMEYDSKELTDLKKKPEFSNNPVKLEMRRDPRDITKVHVLNPLTGAYFVVGAVQRYNTAIPLWEWRASLKSLDPDQRSEEAINRCRLRRQTIEDAAHKQTKTAKRLRERADHGVRMKASDEATASINQPSSVALPGEPAVSPAPEPAEASAPLPPSQRFRNLVVGK